MLRSLGIAFIACSLMLFGMTVGGLSWWLISSRVIQIRGVNDTSVDASGNPGNQTTPAEDFSQWSANDDREQRGASGSRVPRGVPIRTASFGAAADNQLDALKQFRLVRIEGTTGNGSIVWDRPYQDLVLLPQGVTALELTFEADNVSTLNDADNEERLLSGFFAGDNRKAEKVTVSKQNGRTSLKVQFSIVNLPSTFEAGIKPEYLGGQATARLCIPAPMQPFSIATGMYAASKSLGTLNAINDDYLRFDFPATPPEDIRFFVTKLKSGRTQQVFPTAATGYGANGTRTSETKSFALAERSAFDDWNVGDKVLVYAVAKSPDQQFQGSSAILVERASTAAENSATVSALQFAPDDTSRKSFRVADVVYSTPKASVTASVSGAPTDSTLVLTNGTGAPLAVNASSSNFASGELTLPAGPQTLRLDLYQGKTVIASVKALSVVVLEDGPAAPKPDLTGFTLQDNGIIRLKFEADNPLDSTAAMNAGNFVLKKSVLNATPINLRMDPRYDASTGIVELVYSKDAEPGDYTLTISKALTNVLKQNFQSQIQDGGQNLSLNVTKSTSAGLPVESRGLAGFSSDSPEYREYTNPRTYPQGFNPSDKVISRMARLYYFRDAHRVVQLINRKAQSFNRAAVDMREQFADASRVDADRTTVDRREAENKAIRAAQQARAAETALEEHQQALISGRQTVATLTTDLEQVEGILRELQQQGPALESEFSVEDTRALAILEAKDQFLNQDGQSSLTDAEKGQLRQLREKQAAALRRRELLAAAPNVPLSNLDLSQTAIPIRRLAQSRDALRQQLTDAQAQVRQEEAIVRQLMATVQAERNQEISATETWESLEQTERLKREEQFRREVAARTEDPDTYVAGKPDSDDPVAQVSMAVVGEGLIQLRGPRKGVNEVHKMINEIDSPVGQVKVSIHTVQVNGEHGHRMQEVVYRIHCYLDHSRFLTMQSAQLLRNAVVTVASRRAEQVLAICPPGMPQQDRDYRYQEAFFGEDFIQELRSMDSEFLQTGNKVLSLHSMDTTSLSNALFLMALAKNDVRQEVLAEFMTSVQQRLPQYEMDFYTGSAPRPAWRDRTLAEKIKPGALREKHLPEFQMLGQNAQFAAFRGMIDVDVAGPDTMTPMQREFVRLAQIFKSRLVIELELRQRVMERSLIEERVGDYQASLAETAEKEKQALKQKENARLAVLTAAESVRTSLASIHTTIDEISANSERIAGEATQIALATNPAIERLYEYVGDMKQAFPTERKNTQNEDPQFNRESLDKSFFSPSTFQKNLSLSQQIFDVLSDGNKSELELKQGVGTEQSEADPLQTFRIDTNQHDRTITIETSIPFKITDHQFIFTIKSTVNSNRSLTNKEFAFSLDNKEQFTALANAYVLALTTQNEQFTQFRLSPEYKTMLDTANYYLKFCKENSDNVEKFFHIQVALNRASAIHAQLARHIETTLQPLAGKMVEINRLFSEVAIDPARFDDLTHAWGEFRTEALSWLNPDAEPRNAENRSENRYQEALRTLKVVDVELGLSGAGITGSRFLDQIAAFRAASAAAENLRRPLDHKKFLDMLIDESEERYIELVEGTREQTSNIDNYLLRLSTALEDDFNTQFYQPAFRHVREASYFYDVSVGQIETTSIVANNRAFAKVSPQATMEFDLPKRDILINEAANSALAAYNDYGALLNDPNFISLLKLYGGQSPGATYGGAGSPQIIRPLPGLPSGTDSQFMTSPSSNVPRVGSSLEALIPDPAVYKFETGTGYEIRPVIQPDGQGVTYHLNYLYSTNIREPVRADEKHLGRIRQHSIDTDVVSGNYELREVSTYRVALKAARSARGVPFLEDVPGVGVLFRPAVNSESSLQENVVLSQTVIYPTLFDLMGLRWAPAVADLDSLSLRERDFVTKRREQFIQNEVFDRTSEQVDEFLRIEQARRRADLYRTQETIPHLHPNGYEGPGRNVQNGVLMEGYAPEQVQQPTRFIPGTSLESDMPLAPEPRTPIYGVPSPPVPEPPAGILQHAPPAGHGSMDIRQQAQPRSVQPASFPSTALSEPSSSTLTAPKHRTQSPLPERSGHARLESSESQGTDQAQRSASMAAGKSRPTTTPGGTRNNGGGKSRSLWSFPGLKR